MTTTMWMVRHERLPGRRVLEGLRHSEAVAEREGSMSQPLTNTELQELRDGLRDRTESLLLDTWSANIIADVIDELMPLRESQTSTAEGRES